MEHHFHPEEGGEPLWGREIIRNTWLDALNLFSLSNPFESIAFPKTIFELLSLLF
jgi:hypothetical protein